MQHVLRELAPRYAALLAAFGDVVAAPELVEPTARFFPDPFALDAASVQRLLARMVTYAPLADHVVAELAVIEPEEEAAGGGCASGGCASPKGGGLSSGELLVTGESRYGVLLDTRDAGDETVLGACLARGVGGVVLAEAGEVPGGAASELSAVVCGLGVLLLNGASVYKKGCGGLRQHRATHLGVEETAAAVALFCKVHGHSPRRVRAHLATTQAEAFDEAWRWVDGNDELALQLERAPELVAGGGFTISPPRGLIARLFGRRGAAEPAAPAPRARRERSPEEERRLAETRALVERALEET